MAKRKYAPAEHGFVIDQNNIFSPDEIAQVTIGSFSEEHNAYWTNWGFVTKKNLHLTFEDAVKARISQLESRIKQLKLRLGE